MIRRIRNARAATGHFFTERGVSQKTLSRLSIALLVCMLLPLVLIAPYNYPADDDFGFVLPVATAWVQTGSLAEVARAIYQKTYDTYMTWQGDFVSTAFFSITPMIFNMNLYFLSNWFLLALLCLSVGYLLKAALATLGCSSKSVFWISYTATMILVLQFMPCIGEGVYWHNGGMYTVFACTLMLTLGLLLRCSLPQGKGRALWRGVLLALCGFMMGGSFYGPLLGALVILFLWALQSFAKRSGNRWHLLVTLLGFALSLGISLLAPGNQLRQERLGAPMNGLSAVFTGVLDSFDLIGGWLSPQLFAMLLVILPVLWKPLKESPLPFRHPVCFLVLLFGLFSATLVPGIYTGSSYGMGRYMNVIYFNFLLLALGGAAYAQGWFIRWLERRRNSERAEHFLAFSQGFGQRFTALYLSIVIAFLTLGGFAFTIMNTSSVNAAKALVSGEAARFHSDMKDREEYVRVTDSDEVKVRPLDSQPFVFKPDKLPFQGIYGRVRYMKWYFELFYNARNPQGGAGE